MKKNEKPVKIWTQLVIKVAMKESVRVLSVLVSLSAFRCPRKASGLKSFSDSTVKNYLCLKNYVTFSQCFILSTALHC